MRYDPITSAPNESPPACFNCGTKAAAVWQGDKGAVNVCPECAVQVLPRLIADAVWVAGKPGTVGYHEHLTAVAGSFWCAVSARIAAENRRLSERVTALTDERDTALERLELARAGPGEIDGAHC